MNLFELYNRIQNTFSTLTQPHLLLFRRRLFRRREDRGGDLEREREEEEEEDGLRVKTLRPPLGTRLGGGRDREKASASLLLFFPKDPVTLEKTTTASILRFHQ